jgi:hypothetical protein
MNNKTPKAPECVLRSKKAAHQIMNAYTYLIEGHAPLPEDYLIPNWRIIVMDISVENAIKAVFGKSKTLGRVQPDNRSEYFVSVQYAKWSKDKYILEEDHLEAFIYKYCYAAEYYFLYSHAEFAHYIAGCFTQGQEVTLRSDINFKTLIFYKSKSITIDRLCVMQWTEMFDAFPELAYRYEIPVDSSIDNSHTVVVVFHYNGVDQTPQVALLPDLLNRHMDMRAMVEHTYCTFNAA